MLRWAPRAVAVATTLGAAGLAVNGTLFNQVDELLVVTLVVIAGLLAYMVVYELRHKTRLYRDGWWLRIQIDRQPA